METALCDATCLDSLAEKVHGAARDGMMVTLHAVLHNRSVNRLASHETMMKSKQLKNLDRF